MRRIKVVFGVATIVGALFLTSCLKSGDQIQGPQGKQGVTGVQGGDLVPVYKDIFILNASSLQKSSVPGQYTYKWGFSTQSNDTNLSFFVSAVGAKINLNGKSPDWYTFPYANVYGSDLLSLSLKSGAASDTVILTYTSASGWPTVGDSSMNCTITAIGHIGQSNN